MLDAMMRNDLGACEQNTNTLISYASEGLGIADTVRAFRGDSDLKYELQKILKVPGIIGWPA